MLFAAVVIGACMTELPSVPQVMGVCGDGQVGADEACDDGNLLSNDACTELCALARCGDGFKRLDLGPEDEGYERCDDNNARNDDDCLDTCVPARCGDGFVHLDVEDCDLGEELNGDEAACTTDCVTARCGDGLLHAEVEACDDGNTDPTDNCVNCARPTCGDGQVWFGEEACDDGNADNTDGCTTECQTATCGDGFLRADEGFEEACDDGNLDDWDDCTNGCELARCGDGSIRLNRAVESPEYEECEPSEGVLCGEDCRWQFRLVMNKDPVQEENTHAFWWVARQAVCYRHPDRTLWCWGQNDYDQLGNPGGEPPFYRIPVSAPIQVLVADGSPLRNVRDVAIAADHGCAVTYDEELYCWGLADSGQRGTRVDVHVNHATEVPLEIPKPIRALAVSTLGYSGWGTTCVIDGNDDVRCWGRSKRNPTNLPVVNLFPVAENTSYSIQDVVVPGMANSHRLSLSPGDLCARRRDGSIRCRGMNYWGAVGAQGTGPGPSGAEFQLRITQTIQTWSQPADVPKLSMKLGCARQLDGTLRCAGHTYGGLRGDGYRHNNDGLPVEPVGLEAVRQVAVGFRHACALEEDGELRCWGDNEFGAIGVGHRYGEPSCWTNSSYLDEETPFIPGIHCFQTPQLSSMPAPTVYVAAGVSSVCGVTGDGRVWCRGTVNNDGDNQAAIEQERWVNVPLP
jgi:cysteine-rich repeat protein